jgi:hypothetical protein
MTQWEGTKSLNEARHARMLEKIKPNRDAIISDLHRDELSLQKISDKYGLSLHAIESVASDDGIQLRARADRVQAFLAKTRFPANENAILIDILENILTGYLIAEKHGVGLKRVSKIAARNSIDMRERARGLDRDTAAAQADEWHEKWVQRDSLNGNAGLAAMRLPFSQIAKAMSKDQQ